MSVKAAEKIYLQGRSTLPSMSPKTDGRLSTMTTQDEAGYIRAFPSEPHPPRSGARGEYPPIAFCSLTPRTANARS